MTENMSIYQNLREHLDGLPTCYPSTNSGIDLRILEQLFTPEEAKIALTLSLLGRSVRSIQGKLKYMNISIINLEKILDRMYFKGLIRRSETKKGIKKYAAAWLVIGIFEFQVNKMTKNLALDLKQYFNDIYAKELFKTTFPMRTIPIGISITPELNVASYEDIRQIIQNTDKVISIANCVCRQEHDLIGDPCKVTDLRETCLILGTDYITKGDAREISKDEALSLMDRFEKEGLVPQPGNFQNPSFICNCCGCCCGVLQGIKHFPAPAQRLDNNFYSYINSEICEGCELCKDACQMEALDLINKKMTVDLKRCIGCGLCVPECPQDAISIRKKEKIIIPPKNILMVYLKIMIERDGIWKTIKNLIKEVF